MFQFRVIQQNIKYINKLSLNKQFKYIEEQ